MFTGIVEGRGRVIAVEQGATSARLRIAAPQVLSDATPGASIAVNGTCLTVTDFDRESFAVDVMIATLNRTTMGRLDTGSEVNVERAMRADGRFGGHVVQGHVDGTTTLLSRTPGENWEVCRFALPPELARYLVAQGSITVDGVSLTVSELGPDFFEVSLIPTTLAETTLGNLRPGDAVNLEVDVLAKYVERLLAVRHG